MTNFSFSLFKKTFDAWLEDKAPRLGAALAFYSILSLGPLLLLVLAGAGFFFGAEAAQGRVVAEIQGLIGKDGAKAVQDIIEASAQQKTQGIIATLVGVITLIFGASGVFGQLQDAFNTIWKVQPKEGRGLVGIIQDRFLSFSMVFGTGFLLLISLVVSTALSALNDYTTGLLPAFAFVMQIINQLVSFGVITLLFAYLFKYLPDAKIAWHDVWIGALLTAVLFTIGKYGIGLYLGQSSLGSTYGAAGSLVVILVWVYYSAQILFFGAEFTQVYANRFGKKIIPAVNAEKIDADIRAEQGMKSEKATKAL